MDKYWSMRNQLGFNYKGLMAMLLFARGLPSKNRFFCSQWVATVLQKCGIAFFDGKKPYNIRPFDFYCVLKNHIIYEGLTINYPLYKVK